MSRDAAQSLFDFGLPLVLTKVFEGALRQQRRRYPSQVGNDVCQDPANQVIKERVKNLRNRVPEPRITTIPKLGTAEAGAMRRIAGIVNNLTYQRGVPKGFVPFSTEPKFGTAEAGAMNESYNKIFGTLPSNRYLFSPWA